MKENEKTTPLEWVSDDKLLVDSIIPQGQTYVNNRTAQEQQAYEFLKSMYPEDLSGVFTLFSLPGANSRFYSANEAGIKQAAKEAIHLADNNKQVYYSTGILGKRPAKGRGESEDVVAYSGVFMDIDCLGGVHKETTLPTFEQGKELVKDFPLAPSITVESGGGTQPYWLFDKTWVFADEEEWQHATKLLKRFQGVFIRMAAAKGWKLDNTADLARILRVPGTLNRKKDPAILVKAEYNEQRYSVEQLEAAIEKMEKVYPPVPAQIPSKKSNHQFLPNDKFPPADAERIFEECAFMQHCQDDSADLPEPHWHAMLSILVHTENGVEIAHEISSPYPKYNRAETDRKIDNILSGDYKPYTCQTIWEKYGSEFCEGCPHLGQINSPIVLGMKRESQESEPSTYEFRTEKGKFLHHLFAQMLINNHHVKVIIDTPYFYDASRGVYRNHHFNRLCAEYAPNIHEKEYKEVMFALRSIAPMVEKTHTGYIPLKNGLLNLATMQVESFTPEKVFTSRLNVAYDPAAYDINVDNMLNDVFQGNAAMRELFECMMGDVINQDNKLLVKAFILKGPKGTGKSTVTEMICNFLGEENYSSFKLQELDDKVNVPELQGKHANIDPDMSSEYLKEPSNFKKITGGDIISGCRKYEHPMKFTPYTTLIFGLNGMPKYKDEGGAMKDRFIIIPFERRFDRSKGTGSFIRENLWTENAKAYLLNLAIRRLTEMYKRKATGERLLPEVAAVEQAIRDNAVEQCSSLQFAEEIGGLEYFEGKVVHVLYADFKEWLISEGLHINKTKTSFKRDICEHYGLITEKVYDRGLKNTVLTFVKPDALRVAK